MSRSVIVAGIDEAGYGPLLGPLVVSATAFEVPAERADTSLWELLSDSVVAAAKPRDRRIAILDSKKLFQRSEGLARLERTALSTLSACHGLPGDARALLAQVAPHRVEELAAYPWYREMELPLPLEADAGGVRLAAARLAADGAACGVRLAGLFCEPLLEGHYNRLVAATRNKSIVLFGLTTRLMQRMADAFPGRELLIFADKQGGRGQYGRMLMLAFEDRRLVVLDETPTHSAYELRADPARWRIAFAQDGESLHLPVALASILSKYVRELFMHQFNRYWAERAPGIAATAGYYQDAIRFLGELRPHLERLGIDEARLVRTL